MTKYITLTESDKKYIVKVLFLKKIVGKNKKNRLINIRLSWLKFNANIKREKKEDV